jgi:hypothetical protein
MPFETIQDFYTEEQLLAIAEIQRCFQVTGSCDGCEGRKRGCLTECYESRKNYPHPQIWDWSDFLTFYNFSGYTAPGCSIQVTKVDEPRFDVFIFPQSAIDPAEWEIRRQDFPDFFKGGV